MTDSSPLTYQQTVLAEVVTEATVQGSLPVEDCLEFQRRIAGTQSLAEIDRLWDALARDY
ncbi:hypothetical protein [Natrononativus amylolyticus]|uniref:hypothetical protein n=1 Tax=Natrononativus amylolyticus TaxID=2963434 RepID=UPI0020CDF8AD|nr:hypothetical protein [Natrononativus amylolyticus]